MKLIYSVTKGEEERGRGGEGEKEIGRKECKDGGKHKKHQQ